MKFRHILSGLVYAVLAACICSSCTKGIGSSRLTLYLTDAPADYDAVNIEILRIEIKTTDDFGDETWQVFPFGNPGIYNLLEFRNGIDTLLASAELPPGRLSQLRLILGTNNSIVVDSNTLDLPLSAPSAQQSGLKINIHTDLKDGGEYKLWIDFDAARSILQTGTGEYKLKPVLRGFTETESSSIKGNVQPQDAAATIYAISGTDTLAAIPDAQTGDYLIRGMPQRAWKLIADANNGYIDQTINGINTIIGQTTTVDTIKLRQ